jgi:aryl-phospho-beta-D-glucosidase BglC (GH1 family)
MLLTFFASPASPRVAPLQKGVQTMRQTLLIAPKSLRCSRFNQPLLLISLLVFANIRLNATGWHTSGTQIDNPSGAPFVVSGVNWYGAETTAYTPSGLWAQDYTFILNEIKANGFNTIRLPVLQSDVEE